MSEPPNKLGLRAFLTFVGALLAVASFVQSTGGDFTSPYFTTVAILTAIVGAFLAGYNLRGMASFIGERSASVVDKLVGKAVESRLEDMGPRIDQRIESALSETFDGLSELIEEESKLDEVLGELRGLATNDARKAYIRADGKMDPADFRERLARLIEQGDVSGVAVDADSGTVEIAPEVTVSPKMDEGLAHQIERANALHEFRVMDEEARKE